MGVVMESVAEQLRKDGFVPMELRPPGSEERSLFTAVRLAHGMQVDDADVCYWNWREIRAHLLTVWGALDAEASERHGRPIQAHVWTFSKDRTLEEVLDLVAAADERRPDIEMIETARRPDAAGMVAANKPRGALASTLGVLHAADEQSMGRVISRVLDGFDVSEPNESFLDHLDRLANHGVAARSDASEIPKLLSRYFGETGEERGWTFAEFLAHVIEHSRAGLNDNELLAWLKLKSPDQVTRARQPRVETVEEVPPVVSLRSLAPARIGAARSFAALDVETANQDRASICAIGVVTVEKGVVVGRQRWLCQPPEGFQNFVPFNIGVHGIRAGDIAAAPAFAEVIGQVARMIEGYPVLAHNAAFDVGAIRRACHASGAPIPEFDYCCTMALTRATLRLPTFGLAWCADHFGIPLLHHNPVSDAEATALLALALLDMQCLDGLDDLMEQCRLRWGHLNEVEWMRSHGLQPSTRRTPSEANPDADPLHPLYGLRISITGDLVALTRQQAFDRLAELGAQGLANVTRSTQMLVVGDLNPAVLRPGADVTGKMKRAFELQAEGQQIEVISGYDFLAMLD